MQQKTKDEIKAAAILGVLLIILLWLFSLMFPGLFRRVAGAAGATIGGDTTTGGNTTLGGVAGGTYNFMPYGPPSGGGGDCCCGGGGSGCAASPDTIETINSMWNDATNAANNIFNAGNATLAAIIAANAANNPLLKFTMG